MKKIILTAGLCILATSCVISDINHDRRISGRMSEIGISLYNISLEDAVIAMEQAARIQSFIDASEEERKDSRFNDIGYYAADNIYVIGDNIEIRPGTEGLFKLNSEWTINLKYCRAYKAVCIKDSTWTITNLNNEEYPDYSYGLKSDKVSSQTEVRMTRGDSYGFHCWEASTEGIYAEDDTYSASFKNSAPFNFKWKTSSSGGNSIYWSLMSEGLFETDFFINGIQNDWCKIRFRPDGYHDFSFSRKD